MITQDDGHQMDFQGGYLGDHLISQKGIEQLQGGGGETRETEVRQ